MTEEDIFFSPLNLKAFLVNEFGICGCAETDAIIRELCTFFAWIDAHHPSSYHDLFDSRGIYYLLAGMCEKAQLIEHGISLRFPFLTPRGERFFAALKQNAHHIDAASGEAYDGCYYD